MGRKTFSRFLFILITGTLFMTCSSDSPTGTNAGGDVSISIPLDGGLQNIQLPANQIVTTTLTLYVPPEINRVERATIDVKETLKNASVTFQGNAFKAALLGAFFQSSTTGSMLIKVGETPEAACASTITYGPYTLAVGFSVPLIRKKFHWISLQSKS